MGNGKKTSVGIVGVAREIFVLRFWGKVEKGRGCWLWTGTKNRGGYGRVTIKKPVTAMAHRVAWELAKGPIPSGLSVLHRCDVPGCVNPKHLWLGTNADNMRDMFAKGRRPTISLKGSAHPGAKLTEEQVREIRAAKGSRSYRELIAAYGIGRSTLYRIWDDASPHWGHVKVGR